MLTTRQARRTTGNPPLNFNKVWYNLAWACAVRITCKSAHSPVANDGNKSLIHVVWAMIHPNKQTASILALMCNRIYYISASKTFASKKFHSTRSAILFLKSKDFSCWDFCDKCSSYSATGCSDSVNTRTKCYFAPTIRICYQRNEDFTIHYGAVQYILPIQTANNIFNVQKHGASMSFKLIFKQNCLATAFAGDIADQELLWRLVACKWRGGPREILARIEWHSSIQCG